MVNEVRVAAFEGGCLRFFGGKVNAKEVVLALPLNRVIVRMFKMPSGGNAQELALEELKPLNPFPDDELSVSCEIVRESESSVVMLAAALPESSADDIADALDEAKVNVTKIDVLVLGRLRGLWSRLDIKCDEETRKMVLLEGEVGPSGEECLDLVVLDGDQPMAIRAISGRRELMRELTLSLLDAEDFGGPKALEEIVFIGRNPPPELAGFAPVRHIESDDGDGALNGIAERAEEQGTLDIMPSSWREVLEESRFKAKLAAWMAVAGAIWFLILGIMLAVPFVYGYLTDRTKDICKAHRKEFKHVAEMREKVKIVQKYSDHSRGALEIMKAVSDSLPDGMELNSWYFKGQDGESIDCGVRFAGEAPDRSSITQLKTTMEQLESEGDEPERIFGAVNLGAISSGKTGNQRFDMDCRFVSEEEQ